MNRVKTRKIKVGNIYVGGDSPVTVQSMTNTDTRDAASTQFTPEEISRIY